MDLRISCKAQPWVAEEQPTTRGTDKLVVGLLVQLPLARVGDGGIPSRVACLKIRKR